MRQNISFFIPKPVLHGSYSLTKSLNLSVRDVPKRAKYDDQ
jgi:hypothetical protein